MKQKCRLCDQEKTLEKSHIIPKFIFRYQKKTSPTGFIRTTKNPNKTIQDGIKLPFLCSDCEKIFSIWETKFSNNIFYPYQKNEKQKFEYEEWLTKYLASVSFRVLLYVYENNNLDYFSPKMLTYVDKAIKNLKLYLLDDISHPKEQRQLLLLLDTLDIQSINLQPDNFNIYLSRAIEFDILTSNSFSFIYIKYLKFLQLCPIKLVSNTGWRTARINPKKGVLKTQNHEVPDYIMDRMKKGSSLITSTKEKISKNQSDILNIRIHKDMDKLIGSEIGQAILAESISKRI